MSPQFDFASMAYGPDAGALLLMALFLDALTGNLVRLRELLPHPALVFAAFVSRLTEKLNRPGRSQMAKLLRGVLLELVVVLVALFAGTGLGAAAEEFPFAWLLALVLIFSLTIQRGPFDELSGVTKAYAEGGSKSVRVVAQNVLGPESTAMNEDQLNTAIIHHLAGRFADGLVAGVFWFLVFGLPGFVVWRTINIAGRLLDDGLPDLEMFGLVATRLNEALGLLPAWLSAFAIAAASVFVPGASPAKSIMSTMTSSGFSLLRHSERAATAALFGALAIDTKPTRQDLVRAQYLYAVAALLVFAFVVVWVMVGYAI